jgi:uncharacterized protein (DUF58 family)
MFCRFLLRQYNKVYRYDNWMRRHFTWTGHLVLTFMTAAAVFGVDTKSSTTYQLFVFLLVIVCLAMLGSRIGRLKLSIRRQLPRYATVGEPFTYSVAISNHSRNAYDRLALIEQLAENLPSLAQLADFYRLDRQPWFKRTISFRQWRNFLIYQRGGRLAEMPLPFLEQQPVNVKIHFTPLRRGKLTFAQSVIAKPDLFGLFRSLTMLDNPQSCLVLPQRYPVKPLTLPGRRRYQVGGVSLANSVGDSTEFMSLRDYRPGDPLNRLHWKSYAKHGKLIVKEYQEEYFVRRALVLDTFNAASHAQFEAAVSVAASLAMSERQHEALLDLMFVGEQAYCFTAGRGVDHLPRLQEILAAVQPSAQGAFSELQQAVLVRAGLCSSVVCVLLDWDDERQQLIQHLLTQGIPVAVFLIHDGRLARAEYANTPPHFYLIHHQQVAQDLATI